MPSPKEEFMAALRGLEASPLPMEAGRQDSPIAPQMENLRPETEEEFGLRAGSLRRLKALRGYKDTTGKT